MNRRILAGALTLGIVALLLAPLTAYGYETYANTGGGGCVTCHPTFQGRGSLHSLHVGGNAMTNNCNLCHYTGFTSPHTDASIADPNHGCNGCHMGEGLRLAHSVDHGISTCINSGCHSGDGTPVPETTMPAYYGRTDVSLTQPCAIGKNNGGEDYSGDGKGLDNDGDGSYDYNDPDCVGVETTTPSWGVMKSGYGRP